MEFDTRRAGRAPAWTMRYTVARDTRSLAALADVREVADQVRPADLPAARLQPVVAAPPVGDGHPGEVLAEEPPGDVRDPAAVDAEDRYLAGGRGPEPAPLPVLSPSRLVGVDDCLGAHMRLGGLHGRRHRSAHRLLHLADRAEPDLHAAEVGEQLLHRPLRHPEPPGEDRHHRGEARSRSNAPGAARRPRPARATHARAPCARAARPACARSAPCPGARRPEGPRTAAPTNSWSSSPAGPADPGSRPGAEPLPPSARQPSPPVRRCVGREGQERQAPGV
jgi:hypothetical protein